MVCPVGYFRGAFVRPREIRRVPEKNFAQDVRFSLLPLSCTLLPVSHAVEHAPATPPPASTPPRGGSWRRHSSHVRRPAEHPNCCHNRGSRRVGGRAETRVATRRSRKHPKYPGDSRSPGKIYARLSSSLLAISPFRRNPSPKTAPMLYRILPTLCFAFDTWVVVSFKHA